MTPPYAPQPPPQRKSGRGCLIAVAVVGGLMLLSALVLVVGFVLFAQSDVGKTTFKVIGEGTRIAQKGMKAPGAKEVRALGCDQALVIDASDIAEFMEILDAGDAAGMPQTSFVSCQVSGMSKAPSCDDVATTYVTAIGGSAPNGFIVSVTRQGSSQPVCQSMYDEEGAFRSKVSGAGARGGI